MTLSAGTRLGPYEIIAPLGAGGMGEVYRAKDTRLDRTVAIKILPSHLSSQLKFAATVRTRSTCNFSIESSNICGLYDVGSQDGIQFLVMEFLEGETLAHRLTKVPCHWIKCFAMEFKSQMHWIKRTSKESSIAI